jgi:hypothetical protein
VHDERRVAHLRRPDVVVEEGDEGVAAHRALS